MLQIYLILKRKNELTKDELKLLKMQEIVTFVEKESYKSSLKINIIKNLDVIAIILVKKDRGTAHSICISKQV